MNRESADRESRGWAPYGTRSGMRGLAATAVGSCLLMAAIGIGMMVSHHPRGLGLLVLSVMSFVILLVLVFVARRRNKI
jgi:uncharacterized membrane protein (UPF0136 family)